MASSVVSFLAGAFPFWMSNDKGKIRGVPAGTQTGQCQRPGYRRHHDADFGSFSADSMFKVLQAAHAVALLVFDPVLP